MENEFLLIRAVDRIVKISAVTGLKGEYNILIIIDGDWMTVLSIRIHILYS